MEKQGLILAEFWAQNPILVDLHYQTSLEERFDKMMARMTTGEILIGILLCQGCEIKRPATCTSSSSYSSPDGDPDYVETTCRDGDEETKVIRDGDKVT